MGIPDAPQTVEVYFMPEFANPFAGNSLGRKISDDELVRAIRYVIAAEFEAIQLYMQLVEATDNQLAKEVLKDVADEERVHAGEFYRLLMELDPDEQQFYNQGRQEVEEEIVNLQETLIDRP
ncbi:MAG: ferritin family protein [Methanomicrobiaceae archaeon]|nr:ferritin family protein [Methanomicrobiaceae archaeon]